MIWILMAASILGVWFSFVFRIAAVVIISGLTALAAFGYLVISGEHWLSAAFFSFLLLAVMQFSYVVGLGLGSLLSRDGHSRGSRRQHRNCVFLLIVT